MQDKEPREPVCIDLGPQRYHQVFERDHLTPCFVGIQSACVVLRIKRPFALVGRVVARCGDDAVQPYIIIVLGAHLVARYIIIVGLRLVGSDIAVGVEHVALLIPDNALDGGAAIDIEQLRREDNHRLRTDGVRAGNGHVEVFLRGGVEICRRNHQRPFAEVVASIKIESRDVLDITEDDRAAGHTCLYAVVITERIERNTQRVGGYPIVFRTGNDGLGFFCHFCSSFLLRS